MKRLVFWILSLALIAASYFGITQAHMIYSSLWLDIYLALFVGLPLLVTLVGIANRQQGVKQLFQSLFSVTAGLVVVTLVYQNVTENWLWACLAGIVVPAIVTYVRNSAMLKAQMNLAQAEQALKANRAEQVLKLAQEARSIYISRGNQAGQAAAEHYLGIAYSRVNEPVRAARYLNSALALYRATGNEQQVQQVNQFLGQIRKQGVDTAGSAVSPESLDKDLGRLDWSFVLDGVLTIASLLVLVQLWKFELLRAPLLLTIAFGTVVFLFIYGNYAVFALAGASQAGGRKTPALLILYNLAFVLMVASLTGYLLREGIFRIAEFPTWSQDVMRTFSSQVGDWPTWTLPAALGVSVLMMLGSVILASGLSPANLLRRFWGGGVEQQALQLAMGHLDAEEWNQAIAQLTRIDSSQVKDRERRKEVLFCLAFAHHMVDHPADARQYLRDLLGEDHQHREGLYLAGYLALKDNRLDEAQTLWETLHRIAPGFHPPSSRDAAMDSRYYLCVTLYCQAMARMEKDVDEGAEILSRVSEIGALDQEVSDALIRVHIYRCVQFIRRRKWDEATQQAKLAKDKLNHLQQLVKDEAEVRKISGLCQAAEGLVAFLQEHYDKADNGFNLAIEQTERIAKKREFSASPGKPFFEQLLRAAMEAKKDEDDKVAPAFSRDLYFLASIAKLHKLHDNLSGSDFSEVKNILTQVESELEKSLSIHQGFTEGNAMRGLLYYYLATDKAKKQEGIEILRTVGDRVGSRFVAQTIKQYDLEQARREDAQKAYFDLLQQYLRSSSVPRQERESMRESVLNGMKATGQYEKFVGRGRLEVEADREREPTVQEYSDRVALLQEKLKQLGQLEIEGALPDKVQDDLKTLNEHNNQLKELIKNIAQLEQKLLLDAQNFL